MNEATTQPKLDVPGAGLPIVELVIARTLFRIKRWRSSRDDSNATFKAERAEILKLVEQVGDEAAGQQVLIKRLRGLEDSSRYWSIYMVLDHLNIVNKSMLGVIVGLTKGAVPDGTISTADVKPAEGCDSSIVAEFEKECDRFSRLLDRIDTLQTDLTYPHPWFGPLNAAGWHTLAAFHMRLHRKQIEHIAAHL